MAHNGPPHDLAAEQGVLAGALVGGPEVLDELIEMGVRSEAFFAPAHQMIWEAMSLLRSEGSGVDAVMLADRLRGQGKLVEIGGIAYLGELEAALGTTLHLRGYAQIVMRLHRLRKMSEFCWKTLATIEENSADSDGADELFGRIEQDFFGVRPSVGESTNIRDTVQEALQRIRVAASGDVSPYGLSTGIRDLDRYTYGLHPGEVTVLAARPSVGKSSLASQIALAASFDSGGRERWGTGPVGTYFVTLEMTSDRLTERLLAQESRVPLGRLRSGRLSGTDQQDIEAAAKVFVAQGRIQFALARDHEMSAIRAAARRLVAQHNVGLVIVDYLQLLPAPAGARREQREVAVAENSRAIKSMALELNVPVLLLSQLNRESDRGNRPPRLADLRESGSIEQDADNVWLLHRETVKEGELPAPNSAQPVKLLIGKNRNGPIGEIDLMFLPELTRFELRCDE